MLDKTDLDEKLVSTLDRWKHTRMALWVTVCIACVFAVTAVVGAHFLYAGGFVLCAAGLFYSLVKSRPPAALEV